MCQCTDCGRTINCGKGYGTHQVYKDCGDHEGMPKKGWPQ